MLTTAQIERQLVNTLPPVHETHHQRVDRLKREMLRAVMHDYPGGVTVLHLVEEFGLSKSVVQKEINAAVANGKIVRKMVSRKTATTTITYATYRTNGG